MSISLIATTSGQTAFVGTTGTSISLAGLTIKPTDFIVFNVVNGVATSSITFTASGNNGGAGNSTKAGNIYANSTNDTNQAVFLLKQGATVDTSITLSTTDGSSHGYAYTIFQYRGVNNSTPQDVTAVTATGTTSDLSNPGSITPVTRDAVIVECYAGSQLISTAWTAPSGVSNFLQQVSPNKGRAACGDKQFDGNAFDSPAVGGGEGSANDSWAAIAIALRPQIEARYGFWFMHP
jgi:VCBS repeat-containing protein